MDRQIDAKYDSTQITETNYKYVSFPFECYIFLIISFNGLSVISRSATGLTISKIALYLEIKTQIMLLSSIIS